jgi:hypothetical protein
MSAGGRLHAEVDDDDGGLDLERYVRCRSTPGNSRMTRSTTAAIRFSDTMLDEPMASGD